MSGFALDGQCPLVEQRAGKERRAHRLLAGAAVTDPDIDRLTNGLEPYRAAQTSTFPDHAHFNRSPARPRCRTPRRSRTRNLPRRATPPSRRVLPPARNVLWGFSTA